MRWSDLPGGRGSSADSAAADRAVPGPDRLAWRLGRLPAGHPSSPGYERAAADEDPDEAAEDAAYAEAAYGEPADRELADGEPAGGEPEAAPGGGAADPAARAGRYAGRRGLTGSLGAAGKGEQYRPWFSGEPGEPWFTSDPGGSPG